MSVLQEWSQEMLDRARKDNKTTLLYIYTPLCGTCQVASKMLSVTAEFFPKLPIGKIDLNYAPHLAEQWEIESVPCLLIFKEETIIEKLYAFHSVPYLISTIKRII